MILRENPENLRIQRAYSPSRDPEKRPNSHHCEQIRRLISAGSEVGSLQLISTADPRLGRPECWPRRAKCLVNWACTEYYCVGAVKGTIGDGTARKGSFRALCARGRRNRPPSGAAARTGDPNRLKPLQQAVVRHIRELEAESQNGNPGLKGSPVPLECLN